MMNKTTRKAIREFAKANQAIDITFADFETVDNILCLDHPVRIAYSVGIYGVNAALYKGESGKLYAVTSRSTTLFQMGC